MGGEWRGEGRRLTCIFVATSSGGILMGGTIVILKSETMKLVGGQGDDSGYIFIFFSPLFSTFLTLSLLLLFTLCYLGMLARSKIYQILCNRLEA